MTRNLIEAIFGATLLDPTDEQIDEILATPAVQTALAKVRGCERPRCFGSAEVSRPQSRAENCCDDCPHETACANLANRVEAAGGADRAIDYDIAHLTGDHLRNGGKAPAYTASIDAALTLVPEGWNPVSILLAAIDNNRCEDNWLKALPRYICAAALRARQETNDVG